MFGNAAAEQRTREISAVTAEVKSRLQKKPGNAAAEQKTREISVPTVELSVRKIRPGSAAAAHRMRENSAPTAVSQDRNGSIYKGGTKYARNYL